MTHVIIGHSERRQYFGETDDTVNLKLKSAIEAGLIPIVCVGEVLEEREAGLTDDVLRRQCLRAFNKVSAKKAAKLMVAYEPVWAIGTGKTATPEIAADAHAIIRSEAAQCFGQEFANKLRILYGGSVKPDNAHALMTRGRDRRRARRRSVARSQVVRRNCEVLRTAVVAGLRPASARGTGSDSKRGRLWTPARTGRGRVPEALEKHECVPRRGRAAPSGPRKSPRINAGFSPGGRISRGERLFKQTVQPLRSPAPKLA